MAKPGNSGGTGTVNITAFDVQVLLRQSTGLPPEFFVTLEKAKVLADGSLDAKYTYSNQAAPPAPLSITQLTGEKTDGDL